MTFIVRIFHDESGRVSGVIERVRTGEKVRFQRLEALGPLITEMVGVDDAGMKSQRPPGFAGGHP